MKDWASTYDHRWSRLTACGENIHGEADFVESLLPARPASVLDAGCGTGRVVTELAQRGLDVRPSKVLMQTPGVGAGRRSQELLIVPTAMMSWRGICKPGRSGSARGDFNPAAPRWEFVATKVSWVTRRADNGSAYRVDNDSEPMFSLVLIGWPDLLPWGPASR